MSDGKDWSQHLLIMLIGAHLGLANSDVFGQVILKIGQGKVSEKSTVCGNPVLGHCDLLSRLIIFRNISPTLFEVFLLSTHNIY